MMRCVLFLLVLFQLGCAERGVSIVRPHQYPKLEFPTGAFEKVTNEECPFTLEIPSYAKVKQKEFIFGNEPANPCWFDIVVPKLNAAIHCSYYPVASRKDFDNLVNDAFTMASKHNVKASHRDEYVIRNKQGSSGLVFRINGPVATPYQFFISDTTNHFFRGSLYFDQQVNADSIAPVISFLENDIEKILNSLNWN